MAVPRFYVDRFWPPAPEAYDYMSTLSKPDWAWEYLRRNPHYQSVARVGHRKGLVRVRLSTGAYLTRLRARLPHAEAWGLCCFR
jgi:hypothetical protein